jgi:MFS transporter, OFA family, oxalate/formate antiporter
MHLHRLFARRDSLYYGWIMAAATMVTGICTSPGQTYGISSFNSSFRESLSLSDTQLTGAYMLGTLLAALPMTYIGSLFDRYGGKRTLAAVVFVFGLACFATSRVTGVVTLFGCFLLLRMCGQGAMGLIAGNTDAMWFHNRLGTVTGIKRVGSAAAFGVVPMAIVGLISRVGWRASYAILGGIVWLVMGAILLFVFIDRPEKVGLRPDGNGREEDEANRADSLANSYTPSQAMRTRAFWVMAAGGGLWAMIGTGVQFNIQPIFLEKGFTIQNAATWFTILAGSSAALFLVAGILADHIRLNVLLCMSLMGLFAADFMLSRVTSLPGAYATAALFGLGQSFFMTTASTLFVRYYGREHLGKIQGMLATTLVAASAVGPFAMGFLNDVAGGYNISMQVFAVIVAIMVPVALFATPPTRAPHTSAPA